MEIIDSTQTKQAKHTYTNLYILKIDFLSFYFTYITSSWTFSMAYEFVTHISLCFIV